MRNRLYSLFLGIAAMILLLEGTDRLLRRARVLSKAPTPNAYEDLLRIGGELRGLEKQPSEMTQEDTLRSAETDRALIEPVHAPVRMNSAVRLKTERGWVNQHAAEIKNLKRLAVALAIQARAQELNGKTNAAAQTLVDVIFLSHAIARGGIFIDGINSLAVEMIGVGTLRPKVRYLDSSTCRTAVQELEALEQKREAPETILQREKLWSEASFGLISWVGGRIGRVAGAERNTKFIERYNDSSRGTRRLLVVLAARAWELETKQRPVKPSDLVPSVLKVVPVDPVTKKEMTEIPALEVGG